MSYKLSYKSAKLSYKSAKSRYKSLNGLGGLIPHCGTYLMVKEVMDERVAEAAKTPLICRGRRLQMKWHQFLSAFEKGYILAFFTD